MCKQIDVYLHSNKLAHANRECLFGCHFFPTSDRWGSSKHFQKNAADTLLKQYLKTSMRLWLDWISDLCGPYSPFSSTMKFTGWRWVRLACLKRQWCEVKKGGENEMWQEAYTPLAWCMSSLKEGWSKWIYTQPFPCPNAQSSFQHKFQKWLTKT